MKIAVILGAFSVGSRPFDFNDIWNNGRGLTGTDLCFIRLCEELKELGNEVAMFTIHTDSLTEYKGMKLYQADDVLKIIDNTFSCVISINEPNVLFGLPREVKRVVWEMLNDFSFVRADFEKEVDLFLGVCEQHTNHLKKLTTPAARWDTVSLGCDPDLYKDERVPGRVVWCSSADRGLHWLLQEWPTIKAAVPEATLKVFYHFNYGDLDKVEANSVSPQGGPYHHHIQEMSQRIRYMKDALEKLKPLGVEHVGSVSRQQMAKEFSEASLFAFSCDTVAFSEGFSVSSLESHASFTVPIITEQDCLGGIYKNSGCIMIKSPISEHLQDFTNSAIKALKDKEYADNIVENCRDFAKQHTWKNSAEKMNKLLHTMI